MKKADPNNNPKTAEVLTFKVRVGPEKEKKKK